MKKYFLLILCNISFGTNSCLFFNDKSSEISNGPLMVVYGNLIPLVSGSLNPSSIDNTIFSSCQIINETNAVTYMIVNDGTTSLTISNILVSGVYASDFQISSFPATNIAAGESTYFTVLFDPSSVGVRTATIEINSDDPSNPIYSFAIQGTGLDYIECGYNFLSEVVAKQDFEPGSTIPILGYSVSNGFATVSGGTAFAENASPLVAVPRFIGTKSLQVNNSFCSLLFDSVNTININDPSFNFRLASFSKTPSEGSENGDYVSVAISTNGGNSWSNEIKVTGSSQAKWSFLSGTGIAQSTYFGTDFVIDFIPTATGFLTTEGYSKISLNGLPKTTDLRIRITIVNNNINEVWAIDDIQLMGKIQASTVWNGSSWSNGIPNNFTKAIIDGNYDTLLNGNITTCKCHINSGKSLVIGSNSYLSSESDITNFGDLIVEDSGAIIQNDDYALNTGNATVKRNANIRKLDYVYWSSPLQQFSVNLISPNTSSSFIWKWNPILNNPNGGVGFWSPSAGDIMEVGKGYIVRGPNGFGTTPQAFTSIFSGSTINNGLINCTIARGPMTTSSLSSFTSLNGVPFSVYDDNWNLIGNPYPSALNVDSFLLYNAIDNPVIEGSVRLWTHGTLPSSSVNPFYSSYLYNYTANDYITHNGTATLSGPNGFNGFIASCQSFFVLMNEGNQANAQVTFKNFMRENSLNSNSQFYRNQSISSSIEKHRVWLDLVSDTGNATRTVIGYLNNATYQKDVLYDAFTKLDGNQNFYTLIDDQKVCIQGRPLPFENSDIIPLGFSIPTSGNYTIAIGALDGLFLTNQDIFIQDTLLDITHNLKQSPYQFFSNLGTYNNRFIIKYLNTSLSLNNDFTHLDFNIAANSQDNIISIKSNEIIDSIIVFDLLGRVLIDKKEINLENLHIKELAANNQGLLVRVKFINESVVTKKIIF